MVPADSQTAEEVHQGRKGRAGWKVLGFWHVAQIYLANTHPESQPPLFARQLAHSRPPTQHSGGRPHLPDLPTGWPLEASRSLQGMGSSLWPGRGTHQPELPLNWELKPGRNLPLLGRASQPMGSGSSDSGRDRATHSPPSVAASLLGARDCGPVGTQSTLSPRAAQISPIVACCPHWGATGVPGSPGLWVPTQEQEAAVGGWSVLPSRALGRGPWG